MSNLILIVWLGLMAGALYLAWLVVKAGQPTRRTNSSHYSSSATSEIRRKAREAREARDKRDKRLSQIKRQATKKSQLSGREWNQLLTKVQGDTATAERLINHLKMKHPGKSDRWLIEKAIFDLERDKGRY